MVLAAGSACVMRVSAVRDVRKPFSTGLRQPGGSMPGNGPHRFRIF